MADISEVECLRQVTNLQTSLVLREARLAEEAIRRGRIVEEYEDQDDPNAFHVSRGRPTAVILPFARSGRAGGASKTPVPD
jgi:hypothetical protein